MTHSFNCLRLTLILYLFIFLPSIIGYTQEPSGNIRGIIVDDLSKKPISGSSVLLSDLTSAIGTRSDSSGLFIIRNIKPGRYYLKISHIGYQDNIMNDLLVTSGKQLVIETSLFSRTIIPGEVIIKGNISPDRADILDPGSRTISIEETMRYAATFNDPLRVTASYPGVSMMNDQANHIIIRGNSPAGVLWKIEGADVVNPNHLTNAGTFSDKPSLTGGGVAIVSAQMLSKSIFLNGAFPARYGDVLAGIFDYKLRKGNNRRFEFTGQAGFLGLDFSAEGPFSKNYEGSFLINYRYSTIGLFERAGIPIGDEEINFRDLAFKVSLPSKKLGNLNLFAIGGKSITSFRARMDSTKWHFDEDRTDYDFYSDMGVAGLTHEIKPGGNSIISTSLAVSYLRSGRNERFINSDYASSFNGSDRLDAGKISFSTSYSGSFEANSLEAGIVLNHDCNIFIIKPALNENYFQHIEYHADYMIAQPFIQWKHTAGNFSIDPGIHILYSGFNNNLSVEPRLSFGWHPKSATALSFGYALLSMMQHPSVYFNNVMENRLLGLTKTHHFVAGYSDWVRNDLIFRAEIYYQHLFHVPVSLDNPTSFSALNLNETAIISEHLVNKGTGDNYGIDMSLEKSIRKGFYYVLAGSLYNSEYIGSDLIRRDTRFNGKYQVKLTSGREFLFNRKKGLNTFGINISTVLAGGMRYTPVDPELSAKAGITNYIEGKAFSKKFRDYFRSDLRLIIRKDRKGHTETFSLDIQNLTNRKNAAWIYYDELRKSVTLKEQLGILPFFSYRIEF